MQINAIEKNYPISFRQEDARKLAQHLEHRHSVQLIGMKRVGISNFLRFFLENPHVKKKYFVANHNLFISVDLNDLVERNIFAFWHLTFKRILDAVEASELNKQTKNKISKQFLISIQTRDLLMTIDGIRQSLKAIVEEGVDPTIFLIRFDRLKDIVDAQFLDNLQGLNDSSNLRLSYVFTSYRSLPTLNPDAFAPGNLNAFTHEMYLLPAKKEDMGVIFDTFENKYKLNLNGKVKEKLIEYSAGHVQYLHISLIILNELKDKKIKDGVLNIIQEDERIVLQSEELFESLTKEEQRMLLSENIVNEDNYLVRSGLVKKTKDKWEVFSPFLKEYLRNFAAKKTDKEITLTKKEHLLFTLLQENPGVIVERDQIATVVWPEYQHIGVSDWTMDRLVARLRSKLKEQGGNHQIKTIRTRGFKLV